MCLIKKKQSLLCDCFLNSLVIRDFISYNYLILLKDV